MHKPLSFIDLQVSPNFQLAFFAAAVSAWAFDTAGRSPIRPLDAVPETVLSGCCSTELLS
jgi:hypothetical protein